MNHVRHLAAVLFVIGLAAAPPADAQADSRSDTQTPRFAGPSFALDREPRDAAVDDLDGDGLPDLVVPVSDAFFSYAATLVLRGTHDGGFEPWHELVSDAKPWAVALGDVDEDGHADVLSTGDDGTLVVWAGAADGSFTPGPPLALSAGTTVRDLELADLDGDGHLDLAFIATLTDELHIRLGLGDGSFAPALTQAAGDDPTKLSLALVDGDAHLDALIVGNGPDELRLLLGVGDGSFAPPTVLTAANAVYSYVPGDLDGDGDTDLVCQVFASPVQGLRTLLNDGAGAFTTLPTLPVAGSIGSKPALADLDGDGALDLVTGQGEAGVNRVLVLPGRGNGTFLAPHETVVSTPPEFLFLRDQDRDGLVDLLGVHTGGAEAQVLRGLGGFTFESFESPAFEGRPLDLAAADLDGDGHLDLLGLDEADELLRVKPGAGDGSFGAATSYAMGADPVSLLVTDLDGDEHQDVVVANRAPATLTLRLGDGFGGFGAPVTLPAGTAPERVAHGDLTNDGLADLVVATGNGGPLPGGLHLLPGLGGGAFGAPGYWSAGVDSIDVALADIDGDGLLDAAVANAADHTVSILVGRPNGLLGLLAHVPFPGSLAEITLADVDDDGAVDLVVTTTQAGLCLRLGQGDGSFGALTSFPGPQLPRRLDVADVDGDGRPDVVAVTEDGNSSQVSPGVIVWLNLGGGDFAPARAYATRVGPSDVLAADFDEDGRVDLLTHHVHLTYPLTLLRQLAPMPWHDLELALAPAGGGAPSLVGSGALAGDDPVGIGLHRAATDSTAWLLVSAAAANLPFEGGTLVPSPEPPGLLLPLPTGAEGGFALGGTWPPGLPPDVPIWFQTWVEDPAGPFGWTASNALKATTP